MKQYAKTSSMPVGKNVLIRPRIDAILEELLQGNVALVTANAGFGKTTAVASFLERSDYRCVWQQLTVLDNLPMRFWESFVYTVSLHRPELSKKLLKMGFPDSLFSFHKFLQLLTEELYSDNQYVVFVFDDFGLISDESVLDFFKHLVASNLENICMIFISRNPDSEIFPGAGQVMTANELRFTKEEVQAYFSNIGAEISQDSELDIIYDYSKGWPIALYLIALQIINGKGDIEKHLFDSQKIIFNLIDKEIFSQYSEEEQRFFVMLSYLNSFPRDLITNAIGQKNAVALLNSNAFVSYDEKAKSYYLHHTFLDFLLEKRGEIDNASVDKMLLLAGDWCRNNNYFVDSITYYEKCGADDRILDVIQGFEGRRHSQNVANLFLDYIGNISEDIMNKNIMCRIVYAMMYLNNLEIDNAQRQIEMVKEQLSNEEETQGTIELIGESCIGAGLINLSIGNPKFVELFKKADALLPSGSNHWGDYLRLMEYHDLLYLTSSNAGSLEKNCKEICDAIPHISRVLHAVGFGGDHFARAEEYFYRCEFRSAEVEAYKALFKGEEKNQFDMMDNALFLLVRIFLSTGDTENLNRTINQLEKNKKLDGNRMYCVPDVAIGWFYSDIGLIEKVEDWILYDDEKSRPPISLNKDMLLKIRCLIEQREYAKALAVSEKLLELLEKRNLLISISYVLVLKAIIYYNLYELDDSSDALKKAYDITHENNIMTPFVEFGHKTRAMLGFYREHGIDGIPNEWFAEIHTKASTYAKKRAYLLSKYNATVKDIKPDFGLTQREIELLKNMSQGLTRDEIASSMFISHNTVKSMLKMVYNKMGAVNGSDAVRIASAAGIKL